jgi:type III secretion system FlhB-like substrate exporter
MEEEPASPSASLADSLLTLARRRGVAVAEDGSVAGLLAALDPNPLIPHPLLLVAGAVMAVAFRHDRALALPPADSADGGNPTPSSAPSADFSF